jgi:hypothetical protein
LQHGNFHDGICASEFPGAFKVYASVHFLTRQAAREKLAAMRALTDAARARHLALAEHYSKRAEEMRAASQV